MRICSLLPSATEMIADLGLIDSLVGVSDECRWPPAVVGKPVVTATRIDPGALTSLEIDRAVREAVGQGRSLYTVDAELIDDLQPDLIVTQDLCAVCAVSSGELAAACPVNAEVLSLDPHTLHDVAATVRTLAARLDAVGRGEQIVREMWATIEAVSAAVSRLPRKPIFVAEWIDPPFSAGHWVPEMVALAGGRDVLGLHGQPSYATTWEQVVEHEPELVVIAPCGFDADEAAARARPPLASVRGGGRRRRQLLLAARTTARRRRPPARPPPPPHRRPRPRSAGHRTPVDDLDRLATTTTTT